MELHDYEHLGIAMTFKNLVMMFPIWCVSNLPRSVLESFVSYMATLTCNMGCVAAQEETVSRIVVCNMGCAAAQEETVSRHGNCPRIR